MLPFERITNVTAKTHRLHLTRRTDKCTVANSEPDPHPVRRVPTCRAKAGALGPLRNPRGCALHAILLTGLLPVPMVTDAWPLSRSDLPQGGSSWQHPESWSSRMTILFA